MPMRSDGTLPTNILQISSLCQASRATREDGGCACPTLVKSRKRVQGGAFGARAGAKNVSIQGSFNLIDALAGSNG